MEELGKLRSQINDIDRQMVTLFENRMKVAAEIADYKKKTNMPVFDGSREERVIEQNKEIVKDKNLDEYVEKFTNIIMSLSRDYQTKRLNKCNIPEPKDIKLCLKEDPTVGFQGTHASYSEQALFEFFGRETDTKCYKRFEDVFIALSNNEIDYGVLPVENSSTGGISEVYDLLKKYNFYIVGENSIKVDHNLIGLNDASVDDITEIYSHPQAFKQCSSFLDSNDDWLCIPYYNTALSVKHINNENCRNKAAIASREAAKLYGLKILQENICDDKYNSTRFIIIGRDIVISEKCDKISIITSVEHKVGALYTMLKNFAENSINMMKIESRPMPGHPWEYFFYIDIEGNLQEQSIKNAIDNIKSKSSYFKLLGNYPK